MKSYRAAVIGCSRMGGFIDHEVAGSTRIVLPYSHAAGYVACERTQLVACADLRADVMAEFGRQHGVPTSGQYTDYREMIAQEKPDIVSVATQPEPRAEIVIYCAEHGVRALYAEKPLAASMGEADAMVAALEHNSAILNMGANRRWSVRYAKMKEIVDSGELGPLQHIVVYHNGTLFNTGSHLMDLILQMNDDRPGEWVQGYLPDADGIFDGDILTMDPLGEGTIQFGNGVRAHVLLTSRQGELEAICADGAVTAFNDAAQLQVRKRTISASGRRGELEIVPSPDFTPVSSTLRLIEDLVHALDSGEPPRGGAQVARAGTELFFGFIESHRQGGVRVPLPLAHRTTRLQRQQPPRQPKYRPN